MRTYGKMWLGMSDEWMIRAEPHVVIKIKRCLGKVDKVCGDIALTNSLENCRDLLWFIDRYPLEIEKNDLAKLRKGAKKYEEKIATMEEILSGKYEYKKIDLAKPPRDYQMQAAELWIKNGFILLGDDIGLGKSFSAICGLVRSEARPAMVCTLTHLTRQWRDEFNKFAPNITTHILRTGKPYKIPTINNAQPDILITNYHKLNGWADTLSGKMKSVVFDECQELRTGEGFKYAAATLLARKAKYVAGLSATPIFNMGGEMFNVVSVLKEDALGNRAEFDREWCGYKGRVPDPKAFGTYLRESGIMLRRTRADVQRELPPITHIPYDIDCDPKALDRVKGSAAELARLILSEAPEKKGQQFQAAGKFDVIMRQATGIAKATYVADFVKMLVDSGESVILFGWHRAVYDIWMDQLQIFKPAMYTGEESTSQKDESKRRFVSKETPIIIVSLRAGAGLDGLQHVCRTGVFGELDYTSGVMSQCAGRIFRDGQPDPVTMYYLNSTEGTDPIMIDILGIKKQQIDGINNPYSDVCEKVIATGDHIKRLAAQYLNKIAPEDDGCDL